LRKRLSALRSNGSSNNLKLPLEGAPFHISVGLPMIETIQPAFYARPERFNVILIQRS
jgi:hypothetical protein